MERLHYSYIAVTLLQVDAEKSFVERAQHTVKMALTERVIEEEEELLRTQQV